MKEITIDCTGILSQATFHETFSSALSFPDWYGRNLDALHDCLTSIGEDTCLTFFGWDALLSNMGTFALAAQRALQHAANVNPHLTISFL